MNYKLLTLVDPCFPEVLRNIPTPPKVLYVAGDNLQDLLTHPRVTIIGSRKVSAYGRAVTTRLAGDLARAGVVVVSGLAIGVDSVAHRAILEAGGKTIAVLPAGLDDIYPRSHRDLARRIVEQGGALVSEYPPKTPAFKVNFIARNRIAAGLGHIIVVTEAAIKSGTLHTTRFALEQGKEVMAVPGNITSPTSGGANNLIKHGAAVVTSAEDILAALGIQPQDVNQIPAGDTPEEQQLIDLLASGENDGAALLVLSGQEVRVFNQTLTMLEITGKIHALGNNQWSLI